MSHDLEGLFFSGLIFLFGHEVVEASVVSDEIEEEGSGLISGIDVWVEDGFSDGIAGEILNLLFDLSVEGEYFFVFMLKWHEIDFHLLDVIIAVIATV